MNAAKNGDLVTVIYEGMLEDGQVFESSNESGPFEFKIGEETVMPGFEQAVTGMTPGQTKKILMNPENAYGVYQKELVQSIKRSSLGKDADIKPGLVLGMTMEQDGQEHKIPATVIEVSGDDVTIDYNHPLAGKKVVYLITLDKVNGQGASSCSPGCGCSS